jgi:HK97 family phage prohead protease
MPEEIEQRPYENEHACRLRNPDDFKDGSFRRTKRKHEGKEYSVIMGKLKGEDTMTEQAYRYNKETWTASSARSHCSSHDGTFEAAKSSKSDNQDIELRFLDFEETEIRVDDEKPILVGYAARTNSWTDLGFFKERIKPGAFEDVMDDDVRCLKNHDPNLILGRTTNNTLRLKENTIGLHFENDMPDTTTGKDTREEVRSKLITGCSFAFTIAEEDWKYYEDNRTPERTIIKLKKLFDVGPVTYPAYPDTSVAARSLEKFRAGNKVEENKSETDENEEERKKYTCECIDCGHTEDTDKHCKDIKCPECGGDMRRKERPGPGRSEENSSEKMNNLIDDDRQYDIMRKYRKMGRLKIHLNKKLKKAGSAEN